MEAEKQKFIERTSSFVESLPEIGADETFCFDCGPSRSCFNSCCADLTLPLTPYDVLRLRQNLGMASGEFLRDYAQMRSFPETGFPLPLLQMSRMPGSPCPFVTADGCSVYDDRPGACRSYPLGRGARLAREGVSERFFVVREDHCRGFEKGACRTPAQWFANQGLLKYNLFNNRYMRLMSMARATGRPLAGPMRSTAALCLYQLDVFRDLPEKMKLLENSGMSAERLARLKAEAESSEEKCLEFAFCWLEMAIFGRAEFPGLGDE